MDPSVEDFERCYRAVEDRNPRFDGWIVVGVHSTGIFCRPSCPAGPPHRTNVAFYPTAAAAQRTGLRACKRCRPDATPGSPEWRYRDDLVARAMRLIADGLVDRAGASGPAARLGVTQRHLDQLLIDAVGAGTAHLARMQRLRTARVLIESTTLPFGQVAEALGFDHRSQLDALVEEVFAVATSRLRQRADHRDATGETGWLRLRLPVRAPFASAALFGYLSTRAVPGVESVDGEWLHKTLRLPSGTATVGLRPHTTQVDCDLCLADLADLPAAVYRCRHLLDLDADPEGVAADLRADPVLGSLIADAPGLRSPGSVDAVEILVRAIVGQQVSLGAARTVLGRLAHAYGETCTGGHSGVSRTFPSAERLAAADPAALPMPRARADTLTRVMRAVAEGRLDVGHGAERQATRAQLIAQKGIGPWTASYVVMRGLGDPDVLMSDDLGLHRALTNLDQPASGRSVTALAEQWRPWRSYATHHLWNRQVSPAG